MRQAERKKEKDKIAIALMLCFCVIALTSIFTIKSNINKIQDSQSGLPVSENAQVSDPKENQEAGSGESLPGSQSDKDGKAAADEDAAGVSVNVPTVDSLPEGSQSTPQNSSGFCFPVNSDRAFVTNEFSMDGLIYSVTLDQYMVHSGVDIEAPADTQVVSMADGTITAIYTDDRFGNTVEVTHGDGCIAIYSNLSDASMVEVGDTVTRGQILGGIGSTALFESLEPAHLHLELLKDGVYVNPMEYIR